MKKVLVFHHFGLLGGSSVSLLTVLEALRENYEIVVYVPSNPPNVANIFRQQGYNVKTFNFMTASIRHFSGGNSVFDPKYWIHLSRLFFQYSYWKQVVSSEDPDIVVVNSMVLAWMAPLFSGRKSVCFVRETMRGSRNSFMNRLLRRLLDKFSLVFFLSYYDLHRFDLHNALSVVCPNFVTDDFLVPRCSNNNVSRDNLGLDRSDFVLLYVGGVSKLKGIHVLIKAMEHLRQENIKLILLGDGTDKLKGTYGRKGRRVRNVRQNLLIRRIRRLIKKYNISDNVIPVGLQKNVQQFYEISDAVVIPITKPHQARPIFEAGMLKKPVIITDFECNREYAINGVNVLSFPNQSYKCLCNLISILKRNPELNVKLGLRNYELAVQNHSSVVAKQIILKNFSRLSD